VQLTNADASRNVSRRSTGTAHGSTFLKRLCPEVAPAPGLVSAVADVHRRRKASRFGTGRSIRPAIRRAGSSRLPSRRAPVRRRPPPPPPAATGEVRRTTMLMRRLTLAVPRRDLRRRADSRAHHFTRQLRPDGVDDDERRGERAASARPTFVDLPRRQGRQRPGDGRGRSRRPVRRASRKSASKREGRAALAIKSRSGAICCGTARNGCLLGFCDAERTEISREGHGV